VLFVQAIFFGAGGITVLGVNALAMGLLGPLAAWLVWKGLGRHLPRLAIFLGAYIGLQVSTGAVALVLALQHRLSPTQFPTPWPVMAAAMLVPSLTVAGVVEGIYTVLAFRLLLRIRARVAP
jgi:cobalt/nickel transport system permease protein